MQHIHGHALNPVLPLSVHLVLCQIKTYALVGCTFRSIPLRCLRRAATLKTPCRYYAIQNEHICLLHNVCTEASSVFRTVSLCGLSLWSVSVSVSVLPLNRWFVMFGSVNAGTIALGGSFRRLPIVDVTTQALLVTRVRGRTTVNKWTSSTPLPQSRS